MKYSTVLVGLLTIFGLSACERPTVVNTPPASSTTTIVPGPTVVEPGPAGPPGPPGAPGATGTTGEPGQPGGVVIVPVPSEQK